MEKEKPVVLSWHLEDAMRDLDQEIAYKRGRLGLRERNV